MHNLLTITWDQPLGLDLGFLTLRYYSLLFAAGFFAGYFIIKRMFVAEHVPDKWLDSLVTYMVLATVLGARLGHVFFYEWDYYKNHPGKILAVWEGGLASHGAAIAIIIALIIYSKKVSKKTPLWILDRVVIVVALAAMFIRFGNMMNSEIYGNPGNSAVETVYVNPARESLMSAFGERIAEIEITPTGQVFATDSITYPQYTLMITFVSEFTTETAKPFTERYIAAQLNNKSADDRNLFVLPVTEATIVEGKALPTISLPVLGVPRYPTQIFEALVYLLIFVGLYFMYWRKGAGNASGLLFGTFLVSLFGFRIIVEFLKANQVDFEAGMQLNMGQWLSIPLVLVGLYFIITAKKKSNHAANS